MKKVYFSVLDFEGMIPEINEFHDLGYVPDLLSKTRELFELLGEPTEDEHIKQCVDLDILRLNSNGLHLFVTDYPTTGSKTSFIYYNEFEVESINIWLRAHEEAHAICRQGLREELEKTIGLAWLSKLYEEDFCDQAGIWVLKRNGIKPHPATLVPYKDRIKMK